MYYSFAFEFIPIQEEKVSIDITIKIKGNSSFFINSEKKIQIEPYLNTPPIVYLSVGEKEIKVKSEEGVRLIVPLFVEEGESTVTLDATFDPNAMRASYNFSGTSEGGKLNEHINSVDLPS